MERLTPVDLDNLRLRKGLLGYRRADADDILGRASRSLTQSLSENDALKRENGELKRELELFRAQEATLRDALLLAQRTADETREAARRQADTILEEARQSALAERMDLQRQLSEIRWEIERAKEERRRFESEFQAMLERYRSAPAPAPSPAPSDEAPLGL